VLIIGGEEDQYTPPDETRAMFDAAPGEKRLWLVPGAGHAAIGRLGDRDYKDGVASFLRQTIGAP
jgi:pimeloyl-ACP methyl ester carboxylesterase